MCNSDKIFILTGHRKSGTSVFHRLFDGHDELVVYPPDISVLYAYYPFFTEKLKESPLALRERLKLVIKKTLSDYTDTLHKLNETPDGFADSVVAVLNDDSLTDRFSVIRAIRNEWMQLAGATEYQTFTFKETTQAIHFHAFLEAFPDLKMVALIRDPRDNYAALKAGVEHYYSKMKENDFTTLSSLINRAKLDILTAHELSRDYPLNFMSVRFETLLKEPETTMRKVADFLGIEYKKSLINPTKSGGNYEGNSHEGIKFSGLSSQNLNKWKSRISAYEAQVIEYWLHEEMSLFDYKLEYARTESRQAFADFYSRYNSKYFYKDSFSA